MFPRSAEGRWFLPGSAGIWPGRPPGSRLISIQAMPSPLVMGHDNTTRVVAAATSTVVMTGNEVRSHTEVGRMESRNRVDHPGYGLPRKVSVKGREGVAVTVVVTTYRGHVWMSIVPPFTWEAIMDPGNVDQLIRVLALAREESSRRVSVGGMRVDRESNEIVGEVEGRVVNRGNEVVKGESTSVVRGNGR